MNGRGPTRLEQRMPAGHSQPVAGPQNLGQRQQSRSDGEQSGCAVGMAQLVKQAAIGIGLVVGEQFAHRGGGVCGLAEASVHLPVPQTQALRPQQGYYQQAGQNHTRQWSAGQVDGAGGLGHGAEVYRRGTLESGYYEPQLDENKATHT